MLTSTTTKVPSLLPKVCSSRHVLDAISTALSAAGFIPGNPSEFVFQLSGRLADFAPELTLDFISEVSAAMAGLPDDSRRIGCIYYMSPWIKNLCVFSNATSPHFERSGSRLRDCIRTISELSVNYPTVCTFLDSKIRPLSFFSDCINYPEVYLGRSRQT